MNTKVIIIIVIVIFLICISISIYSLMSSSSTPEKTQEKTQEQVSAPPAPAPAPVPAASLPEYKPFIAGSQTATDANDWGGGNAIFLDRHNINCDNKPINQIHLSRPAGDKIQWKYTCSNGGNLGSVTAKTTPANDWGGGNTVFLDRHDANCGDNNVMTQLRLARPAENQIQWQYSCAPNTQSQKLTCRQVKTDANDAGGGNTIYLDRHNVKCNPNEAISRINLKRTDDNNYQFEYTCCS